MSDKEIIAGAGIQFEWIRTEEQWAKLINFASSFNHKVIRNRHPVCAMKKDGRWIGYMQHYQAPLVFTAWHEDKSICKPRDVIDGMLALSGWAKIQHGGGMTAVPTDTKTFTPDVMNRFGAIRCGTELYEFFAQ